MKNSLIPFLCATLLSTVSCQKMKANKLEGTYSCQVDYYYWNMSSPMTVVEETYQQNIHVEREKDSMNMDGTRVPFHEVINGQRYSWGGYHYNGNVLFTNDSMYLYRAVLLGLGGGYNTTCACSRE